MISDSNEFVLELLSNAYELKIEGRSEEAIKVLNKLIQSEPNCFEAYEELADNYITIRALLKAKKALAEALRIAPKSPNAHYLMGFLFSLKENWKASEKEFDKADQYMPNHPEILRCLGWAVFNQNRSSQGISLLERAKNLDPNDANTLCDLGVCYMNSAQVSKARTAFESALKIDPYHDQAVDCLNMLSKIKDPVIPKKKAN